MGCGTSNTHLGEIWKQIHLDEVIGTGGFATIRKGIYKPKKQHVAVKIIGIQLCLNRSNGLDMIRTELEALKLVSSCPHLTNLHFAYHDYLNCYLVMDLFLGGDLRYYLTARQRFKENQISFVIGCIGTALDHIHNKGVLHRDVKPENILFDSHGFPKLTDFGVSYVCEDSSLCCTLSSGTLSYLAPEILTSSHVHGKGADYWSLGVVMFEMLYLSKPWKTHCPKEFVKYIEEYYNGEKLRTRRYNSVTHYVEESHDSQDECPHLPNNLVSQSTHSHPSFSIDYHPHAHRYPTFTSFNQSFEENDRDHVRELPSSLTVPLNEYTAYGQYISNDCLSILSGLLDIRLERRLGSSQSSTISFFNHPWWELTQTPLHLFQQAETESQLLSIQSPVRIDTYTVQETIKWSNKLNLIPLLKPEAVSEISHSQSLQSNTHSTANFSIPLPFSDGLRLSFSWKGWKDRGCKTKNNSAIIPMNYSDNVMSVLENYFYLGPLSHR